MKYHYVKKNNECLLTIAKEHGISEWEIVHEHPSNQELWMSRKDPFCLKPGDKVAIPDSQKQVSVQTSNKIRVVIKRLKAYLAVALINSQGQPLAKCRFELTIANDVIPGESNDEGRIEVEIPMGLEKATLTLWPDADRPAKKLKWKLNIGSLYPVEDKKGQAQRLCQLGYLPGFNNPSNSCIDEATTRFKLKKQKGQQELADEEMQQKLIDPLSP